MADRKDLTEGARKAYAAQRKEGLKLWLAGICCAAGLLLIFLSLFARVLEISKGVTAGAALFLIGFVIYRTTVAHEIAKKGPRLPHRIRLPFDSTVEIGVQTNVVQGRTDILLGDNRPPPETDVVHDEQSKSP